jgi:hypothetical protein
MNIEFVLALKNKYFREYIKMCTDIYILEKILFTLLKRPNILKLKILFKSYQSKKFIYYLNNNTLSKIVFGNILSIIKILCPPEYKVRIGFLFRKIIRIYNYQDAAKFYIDDPINLWHLKKYGTNDSLSPQIKFHLFK